MLLLCLSAALNLHISEQTLPHSSPLHNDTRCQVANSVTAHVAQDVHMRHSQLSTMQEACDCVLRSGLCCQQAFQHGQSISVDSIHFLLQIHDALHFQHDWKLLKLMQQSPFLATAAMHRCDSSCASMTWESRLQPAPSSCLKTAQNGQPLPCPLELH